MRYHRSASQTELTVAGLIEAIYIAPHSGEPMQLMPRADLIAGCGIRGDRNFKDTPAATGHDEQITLIAAEEIERFRRETRLRIDSGDPRRNVVTRGVALNELVGREFTLGSAVLYGVELCEPCATLGATAIHPRGTGNCGRGGIGPSRGVTRTNRIGRYDSAGRRRRRLTPLLTRVESAIRITATKAAAFSSMLSTTLRRPGENMRV